MSQTTRQEVLGKLRRRCKKAGPEHKTKLLNQAVEVLGYHRKAAIRALGGPMKVAVAKSNGGRPASYKPALPVPWLRPIWRSTDYACGRRLVAMLPEWIPAYGEHEKAMPGEVREKLLKVSGRTLDRLLEPPRTERGRSSLTRPGTLLRQQIPIRGSVWEEGKPGWLEVDTVALCGGSVAGEFVWMVDGVGGGEGDVGARAGGDAGGLDAREAAVALRVVGVGQRQRRGVPELLASEEVTAETKRRLMSEKSELNPFAPKLEVARRLKEIARMRRGGRLSR